MERAANGPQLGWRFHAYAQTRSAARVEPRAVRIYPGRRVRCRRKICDRADKALWNRRLQVSDPKKHELSRLLNPEKYAHTAAIERLQPCDPGKTRTPPQFYATSSMAWKSGFRK